MKTRRTFALLLAALLLVSLFAVAAFATPSKPYGSYSTIITYSGDTNIAISSISKCSCSPVDNYLKAGIQVQYKEGNGYYWIPSETTVYYRDGEDVVGVGESITHDNIVFAHGQFKARCGSGAEKSYWDSDTNWRAFWPVHKRYQEMLLR